MKLDYVAIRFWTIRLGQSDFGWEPPVFAESHKLQKTSGLRARKLLHLTTAAHTAGKNMRAMQSNTVA